MAITHSLFEVECSKFHTSYTDILVTLSHHYAYSLANGGVFINFHIVLFGYYTPIYAVILTLEV